MNALARPMIRPECRTIAGRIGPNGVAGMGAGPALKSTGPAGQVKPRTVNRARYKRYRPLSLTHSTLGVTPYGALYGLGDGEDPLFWQKINQKYAEQQRRKQEIGALVDELRQINDAFGGPNRAAAIANGLHNRAGQIVTRLRELGLSGGLGSWLSKAFKDITGTKLSDITGNIVGTITQGIIPGIPGISLPKSNNNAPPAQFANTPTQNAASDAPDSSAWMKPLAIGGAALAAVGLVVALAKK